MNDTNWNSRIPTADTFFSKPCFLCVIKIMLVKLLGIHFTSFESGYNNSEPSRKLTKLTAKKVIINQLTTSIRVTWFVVGLSVVVNSNIKPRFLNAISTINFDASTSLTSSSIILYKLICLNELNRPSG